MAGGFSLLVFDFDAVEGFRFEVVFDFVNVDCSVDSGYSRALVNC